MSQNITWRNIDAPNIGDPSRTLALSGASFKDAFSGLQSQLDKLNATEMENWNRAKENNTNAMLARLAEFQSPEAAQEALASGALRNELAQYGAQVDQRLISDRMGSLVQTLQDRARSANEFARDLRTHKDWQETVGQRDVVNGLNEALLRASTPEEVANIKQAISIYQGSNMLNSQGANDLVGAALQRREGLIQEERGNQEWAWRSADAEHAQQRRPLELEALRADIRSRNATASRQEAETRALSNAGPKPDPRLAAAYEQQFKNSILGDGSLDSMDGRKALRGMLKDSLGLTDNAIQDVIDNLYETYPQGTYKASVVDPQTREVRHVEMPIPVRAVIQAVSGTQEDFNGSFWSRRGDKSLPVLQQILSEPETTHAMRESLYLRDSLPLRAIARDESRRTAADPTP